MSRTKKLFHRGSSLDELELVFRWRSPLHERCDADLLSYRAGGLFVVLKAVFDVLFVSRRLFASTYSGTGWSVTMIFRFWEEKYEEKDIERGKAK